MQPQRLVIPESVRADFAPFFISPADGPGFRNPWPHPPVPKLTEVLRWKTQRNQVRPPDYHVAPITLSHDPWADYAALGDASTRLFWIGHASFLVELDHNRFVIDPIFGRAGGVVGRVTPAAATPAQLTDLRAVLVTHGHHDHLDPAALRALAEVNEQPWFVVPRGLAKALPRQCQRVIELDWWHYVEIAGTRVCLVPAQHWHRRSAFDQNRALWGGYVLEGTHRVFHSGDTGYFPGFLPIGRVFGGIDAACLPLGAYEPRWFMGAQHMAPEQSLDALAELAATHFVGMHWGAYDLSDEPLDAGPRLVLAQAAQRELGAERLHVLRPGGSLGLHGARGTTIADVRGRYEPT
ncbi:MAG: MBL fold metallo-hydrolase [Polyangiales bacterium]